MKFTNLVYALVFIIPSLIGLSQVFNTEDKPTVPNSENVVWNSIQNIENLNHEKFTVVDVYTDWCRVCQVMDEKTFSDPDFMSYLTENYNLVKFNAEEKTKLMFKGKSFEYKSNGKRGYNALAAELCKGKLAYPSFVVLDQELQVVDVLRGFKNVEKFKADLERARFADTANVISKD